MKKIFLSAIFLGLLATAALQAETVVGNASVSAKKQPDGLYTITIKDPQGLKSFALKSPGNLPYGGELSNCPRVFVVNNVSPVVVNDFSGEVDADIVDCQDNSDELAIPEIGDKKAVVGKHEEAAPVEAPKPTPAAVAETAPAAEEAAAPTASTAEITYPISDLGGCASKDECKLYCEESANMRKCVDFADDHNLISKQEAEDGRKFSRIVNSRGGGPGGCKTREACEAFCESVDNLEVCLAFAEDSDLVDAKDIDEMRKIAGLLKSGEKFPGGCKSKSQCEAYCADPDNMEACLAFAEKAGFIPPEELEMARKVLPLMKAGKTPGGCRSKEACEAYCDNPDNLDACVAFAEQMGFISPEELTIIKKTGGKGPGGCRGKKECESFCQIPENQETCYNFGKDNGLISEDDLKQMEEGMGFIRDALSDESSELGQCLSEALGPDNVARIKNGQPIFDRNIEDKLKGCFEEFPPGGGGGFPGGGPGGCTNQEECQAYCEENPEECEGFGPPGGGGGGFSGPGGCTNQEECQAYCEENPEECEGFGPPGGGGPGGPVYCGTEENPEECQQLAPPGGGGGGFPGGGPGGCTTPEECTAYCQEHPEECGGGGGTGGTGTGGGSGTGSGGSTGSGPGGCTSQETCAVYCQTNYTDPVCGGSGSGGGSPSPSPTPIPAPTSSCAPVPSGLVLWLQGDDLSGLSSGGVSSVSGKVRNAFKFDGFTGYATMGNPSNLNFGTGPFSLEAWFNWAGGGNSGALNLIRKSNYPATGPGSGYWLRIGRDSQLMEFSVGATTGPDGQSLITAPISSGAWHHVAATRDDSGNVKLYIDGQSRGAVVRQASGAESTSEAPFTLGAWIDRFGATEFFPGLIDDVSVYNRALSVSEVQAIFNAGSAGKCSGSQSQHSFESLLSSFLSPALQLLGL